MAELIRGATYQKDAINLGGSIVFLLTVEDCKYLGISDELRKQFIKNESEISFEAKAVYSEKDDRQFLSISLNHKNSPPDKTSKKSAEDGKK